MCIGGAPSAALYLATICSSVSSSGNMPMMQALFFVPASDSDTSSGSHGISSSISERQRTMRPCRSAMASEASVSRAAISIAAGMPSTYL